MVRQYHPDRNPGDAKAEERFKEIQQAYDLLSDPDKRKAYDRGGFGPQGAGAGAGGGGFGGFDTSGLGDLFSDLFGRGSSGGGGGGRRGGAPRQERGRDLEFETHITFAQSI